MRHCKGQAAVTVPMMLLLWCVMVGTALLSGIFGMAGGMILIGVLLVMLPVPDAMALHAVTQLASNGWRAALWVRYVQWRILGPYALGCAAALLVWALLDFVPDRALAMLGLGLSPFAVRLLPKGFRPDAERARDGTLYGFICMTLMVLTGVSGPLLDTFFLGGKLERRQIVATKALCQVMGHALKLLYFGGLVAQSGSVDPVVAGGAILCSMLGTTLAKRVLEAMTDTQYRLWANRIIAVIAGFYVLYGGWLVVAGGVMAAQP
jgi:uncharacterized membrane protein YfcA